MAANLSDNLNITKAPPVGAFVYGDTTGVFAKVHSTSTPVISPNSPDIFDVKKNFKGPVLQAMVYPLC